MKKASLEKLLLISTGHIPKEIAGAMDVLTGISPQEAEDKKAVFRDFVEARSPGAFKAAWDFLNIAVAPSPYGESGWMLFALSLDDTPECLPELAPLRDFAKANDCRFVLFDCDEPHCDELPKYEW